MLATPDLSTGGLGSPFQVLSAQLPEVPGRLRRGVLKALLLGVGPLVSVEGAERLRDLPEPAIFVFNHSNSFEAVVAPAALIYLRGRPLHLLVDWMFLHIPLVGGVIRLGWPIPVYGKRARWGLFEGHRRARARRPVVAACLARLAAGASIGLFPEGTRNPDPHRLLPARRGLGELALAAGVPVVPVGIRYPAARRLGRAPRLGRMVLAIGEPVDLSPERRLARSEDAESLAEPARRALAQRAAARIMARLAELAGKRPARQLADLPPGDSARELAAA